MEGILSQNGIFASMGKPRCKSSDCIALHFQRRDSSGRRLYEMSALCAVLCVLYEVEPCHAMLLITVLIHEQVQRLAGNMQGRYAALGTS
jgi:hypothetical protein